MTKRDLHSDMMDLIQSAADRTVTINEFLGSLVECQAELIALLPTRAMRKQVMQNVRETLSDRVPKKVVDRERRGQPPAQIMTRQ